jgi:hypothetical protein
VQTAGTVVVGTDAPRFGTGDARIHRVTLTDLARNELTAVHFGQPFRVRMLVEAFSPVDEAVFEVGVSGGDGDRILTAQNIDGDRPPVLLGPGLHEVEAEVRATLLPGEYTLTVGVHRRSGVTLDYVEQVLGFGALNVAEVGGDHYPWRGVRGYVRPDSDWSAPVPVDVAPKVTHT